MVGARIVGVGMQQNRQTEAFQLHPGNDHREEVVGKPEVERWRHMRATRLQIPIAQLHRKALARPATDEDCLLIRVGVEIKCAW